ncbi:Protein METABOLIC NETWORK MODULATOR 1 [Cardamine amara subsp. amara]|uniref:Protein METABOLIC NETWORK MODULATOR 1 n=1 Tax=Cardamine amara subsp. amara TaxID=228776 RepID=A0ABD0ZEJ7_CARAN
MENNHTPSGDLMAKRKRGRPRKYPTIESNVQPIGPVPGSSMTQPQIHPRDNMVGQAIRGVVEATFEDGFFLSVKIENSDGMLRGVVFKPGRCVPVSVHNDVAPHLPMIRGNMVHPHASGNGGKKFTVSESRGSGDRSLITVPVQPAHPTIPTHRVAAIVRPRSISPIPAHPAQPANPAQLASVPIPAPPARFALPAHPTIPAHHVVPVVFQPVHRQNGDDGVPMQPAHQAIIRNPRVSVKHQPPHLRGPLPVNRGPM